MAWGSGGRRAGADGWAIKAGSQLQTNSGKIYRVFAAARVEIFRSANYLRLRMTARDFPQVAVEKQWPTKMAA